MPFSRYSYTYFWLSNLDFAILRVFQNYLLISLIFQVIFLHLAAIISCFFKLNKKLSAVQIQRFSLNFRSCAQGFGSRGSKSKSMQKCELHILCRKKSKFDKVLENEPKILLSFNCNIKNILNFEKIQNFMEKVFLQ